MKETSPDVVLLLLQVLKELPSKHDETRLCPMVEDQAKKYEELIQKFSAEVQVSVYYPVLFL